MATGTNTSASKIALVVVLIPILVAAWFVAPWFLPMWRWQNVDFEQIVKDHAKDGYTKERIETEFEMVVWYHPRNKSASDPCPYQIYSCKPSLKQIYPDMTDEDKLLVRVALVNDQNGGAISDLWIGVTEEERFFKISGWRLPPGTLGKASGRQVVLFKNSSLQKVDLNLGVSMAMEGKYMENDDAWDDRFDGWEP